MKNKEQNYDHLIDDLWDSNHQMIGTDIGDLDYFAGRDVMLKSDFEKAIKELAKTHIWTFDCWHKEDGISLQKDIEALTADHAIMIFKNENPDMGFDYPYN